MYQSIKMEISKTKEHVYLIVSNCQMLHEYWIITTLPSMLLKDKQGDM